jgi:hypothetical protein
MDVVSATVKPMALLVMMVACALKLTLVNLVNVLDQIL